MEEGGMFTQSCRSGGWRRRRLSSSSSSASYERLAVIGLGLLAVVSPLYIDRRALVIGSEIEEQPINISSYLPILLLMLILAISISRCLDHGCPEFDPCWIYRVGGSSGGIIFTLLLLAIILWCKASTASACLTNSTLITF
ncbi:hypothetical protein NMG60_11025710 [Bertholletia excelsa]